MKGYSGLTIKPNRSSNADGKNFSKESSNKKNKHHESPTSSSGKKTEIIASNNSSQNSSPSSSPRKRSRTSSERSDKDTKTGAPDRRDSKTSRHEKAEKDKRSPAKGRSSRDKEETDTKWRDYRERQKAVLKRTYRKTPGVSEADEAENKEPIVVNLDDETIVTSVDVDLRFQGRKDVDLRSEVDSKTEPPAKKSRGGNNFNSLDQYYTFLITSSIPFYLYVNQCVCLLLLSYLTTFSRHLHIELHRTYLNTCATSKHIFLSYLLSF